MRGLVFAVAVVAASPATAMELQSFRTPSNNIHCLFITDDEGQSSVECELRVRGNGEPLLPVPADCDLDWGNRFALGTAGRAGMVCNGDTLVDPGATELPYGNQLLWYGIACESQQSGLTCVNDSGHGFSLSRAKQRLF